MSASLELHEDSGRVSANVANGYRVLMAVEASCKRECGTIQARAVQEDVAVSVQLAAPQVLLGNVLF